MRKPDRRRIKTIPAVRFFYIQKDARYVLQERV